VPHAYGDKFTLAEFAVTSSISAQLNALAAFGLDDAAVLKDCVKWADKKQVHLRVTVEESCEFDREERVQEEGLVKRITDYVSSTGKKSSVTDRVETTVIHYHWKYQAKYTIRVFSGTSSSSGHVIGERTANAEVVTTVKKAPHAETTVNKFSVNLTWLFSHLSRKMKPRFTIDREDKACATPRRNPEAEAALSALRETAGWATRVAAYITNNVFPVLNDHNLDLQVLNQAHKRVFVPVVPLFEDRSSAAIESVASGDEDDEVAADEKETSERGSKGRSARKGGKSSRKESADAAADAEAAGEEEEDEDEDDAENRVVLSVRDVNAFLAEQQRSLNEEFETLAKLFPDSDSIISVAEANQVVTLRHLADVCSRTTDTLDYIEGMLERQLIDALGKRVGAKEFAEYMVYHNRRLFAPEFAPQPFSYAVRRLNHYPEGVLAIDQDGSDPVYTSVVHRADAPAMSFPLNAATNVSFEGDHYLHCSVRHTFSFDGAGSLTLSARARQFSSFILLVGNIAGPGLFDAKHAIILENKDEVLIPLLLETLPTPKEFRDAIESLSPEQQRFAKAFRAMQLESTLFGVAVIQIKPALERLLNLEEDSLTKEISLTQKLMELFIEYQIPSDLMSYAGDAKASIGEKVTAVKGHVQALYDMIDQSKAKELEERKQEASYAVYDSIADDVDECCEEVTLAAAPMPRSAAKMKKRSVGGMSFGSGGGGGSARRREMAPMKSMAAPPMAMMSASSSMAAPPPPSPGGAAHTSSPVAVGGLAASAGKKVTSLLSRSDAPPRSDETTELVDYTQVPSTLDRNMEALDLDSALRPTTVKTGPSWTRKHKKALLAPATSSTVDKDEQKTHRNKAFDLLDALSRSGELVLKNSQLHVVIVATHSFAKSVIDTVVQDNVNPIEKVERSSLIVCSTIHNRPASELVRPQELERVSTFSPNLFVEGATDPVAIAASSQAADKKKGKWGARKK
jgi:hypothetical protein